MLLLSSLLLLVDGVTAVSCIPTVAGISAIAGVPLVPDVLTVAGLHCIADVPCVLRFYAVACVPAVVGVFAIDSVRVDPGVPIVAEPVFVNLLRSPGIDSQSDGPVRQPCLSCRPAMLHRQVESNPRIRFLVSLNVYKYGLWCLYLLYCTARHFGLSECNFFCYRTIGI
jgi:hypothetical protein